MDYPHKYDTEAAMWVLTDMKIRVQEKLTYSKLRRSDSGRKESVLQQGLKLLKSTH